MDLLKAMETFARVAKLGSYTNAAQQLKITPAMVSKRILVLEEALNIKLLYRNTHQVSLTSAGGEYLIGCLKIISDIKHLTETVTDKQKNPKGHLKILSSKAFAESILSVSVQ